MSAGPVDAAPWASSFWEGVELLAELPGFRPTELSVGEGGASSEGGSLTVRFERADRAAMDRASFVAEARRGSPRAGELALDGIALRYAWTASRPPDETERRAISEWLRRLGASHPALETLGRARPIEPASLVGVVASRGSLAGWRLAHRDIEGDTTTLDFGEPHRERRAFFELSTHQGGEGPWLRARHRTPAPDAIQDALRVVSAFAFGARTEGANPSRPSPSKASAGEPRAGKRSLEVIAAPGAHQSDEVRLVLNGPCGQHCSFCSIPDTFFPADGGDAELAAHTEVLASRAASGARIVRLTGVDPLASSFVLPLVRRATALGYEEMIVNSPCTRLAERGFSELLVAAMPKRRMIVVPLYGVDPRVHDAVVGRAGAHALVTQAIEHLLALSPAPSISLSTVLTPEVVPELAAIARFAEERHLALNLYLPFPDRDSPLDRFQRVTRPQTEVAREIVASGALSAPRLLQIRGLAPCVALEALADRPRLLDQARTWLASPDGGQISHDGARTAHRDCPHRAQCSLVPPCSGTLLEAYVARHGLAELRPPEPAEKR